MKKVARGIMGLLIIATLLTGCVSSTNTETMTAKEFKRNMENMGFVVEDQTTSAADSTYQKIYVALDEGKYSFEYYFMKGENSADIVYKYAVSNLNKVYGEATTATILEEEKNSIKGYSVSASDYYCEVIKKENTVLYVTAYHGYEDEAKGILKDMGY